MKNSKHTPGPWRIEFVLSDDDKKHARVWPENEVAHSFFAADQLTPKLIAAAPELLEVLREIADTVDFDHARPELVERMHTIIRKAKGA
jgi:hypothetical protein